MKCPQGRPDVTAAHITPRSGLARRCARAETIWADGGRAALLTLEVSLPQLWWALGGILAIAALGLATRGLGRSARTRATVLEEVRRSLRGGVIEKPAGRGRQVRGQLGQLEITVDLQSDAGRPRQSPMWRVLAVGPVAIEPPIEARVAGWEGWIDPWLQLGETLRVPPGVGPEFSLHAERMPTFDHPVLAALRRQGERLGPGALYARPDLMRAETRFGGGLEENRPLFAYLHTMAEISELPRRRTPGAASRPAPRDGVRPEGR